MRNYVNTDDELKLLYELTGLAHLLSLELIQALLGCSWCRLPDPRGLGPLGVGKGVALGGRLLLFPISSMLSEFE